MDRKAFFQKGIAKVLGKIVKETTEIVAEVSSEFKKISEPIQEVAEDIINFPEMTDENPINKKLKKPPGALEDTQKFKEKCTGCGDCIHACPYNTIFPVFDDKENKNIPYMDLNMNACMMCNGYPCISACQENALKPYKKKQKPNFGQAVSKFQHCINFSYETTECNQCQVACPIENVVSYKKGRPSFSRSCTGCGLCVQVCPVFPKAILIR